MLQTLLRVLAPAVLLIGVPAWSFRQAAPANDNFANAIVLTGNTLTTSGSNVAATKEAGEPNHAGNSGGASVWWSWTAPAEFPA